MASNQQASGSPSKKRGLAASIKRFVGLLRGRKGQNNTYTRGPIAGTMLRTALVMLPGTLTISGYNLVDAYFVGQLEGDAPMAAIGLTAPLVMICGCFFHGLSAGVMTTTAQSLGGNKRWRAEQLVSTGLLLITLVSLMFAIIGPIITRSVYRNVMHASPEATRLATSYMDIWFWACVSSALGMSGNNLLVTANDSKMASATMVLGLASNALLDPVFMFRKEVCGIPLGFGLGVVGAAWATVMAQIIGTTPVLAILWKKHHLIRFRAIRFAKLASLWKRIISFAIPACLGSLMLPIGQFIMTWITSHFGDVVIGAITAAQRVQVIAFFFPMSLGVSLMPMIGQNYGARLYSRINGCRRFAMRFAFIYLMTMSVVFCVFAPFIAAKFLSDPDKGEMRAVMEFALRILPWGFAFLEVHRYSGFFFTGCGRPMAAALLNAMRILGFLVPLSLLVLLFLRLTGNESTSLTLLLVTQMGSDVLAGTIALILARRLTRRFPADGVSESLPPPRRLFKRAG
ncbi:MAG: MATE family efflux transporter [Lentisphaeria bacterium]|nr:MATE family efflux transporter [Lentisphaeria bacterium]